MLSVYAEAKALVAHNAQHRNGDRIGDVPAQHAKDKAADEMCEFLTAKGRKHEIEEMADTINCLMLYAVKRGWPLYEIEAECLRKLALRFPAPEPEYDLQKRTNS